MDQRSKERMRGQEGRAVGCPMCGESSRRVIARRENFRVMGCPRCDFGFIDLEDPGYPGDAQYHCDEAPGEINPRQPHIERRVRDILRFRKPPGSAIDIGCGKGEVSLRLAEAGFKCAGLDFKPRLIRFLRERAPQIEWIERDASSLADEGRRFDVVTLYHVLEHIPRPLEVFGDFVRLLEPGGLLVVEVPNAGGLRARWQGGRWHYCKVDHVNYFKERHLRQLGHKWGLEVVDVRHFYHLSYPQGHPLKDAVKGALAVVGMADVIGAFYRKGAR